jgi:hypothetical protein
MRFVLILNYKHVRTAGLTVYAKVRVVEARTVSTLALAVRCSNHSAIYLVTYSEEAEAVGMEQNC